MKRLLAAAIISACAVTGAVLAIAAEGIPGATVRPDSAKGQAERQARREQWCKANPEKCREMEARREQWCKDNPERCGQMKARMEERRKQCEANPAECRPGARPGRQS